MPQIACRRGFFGRIENINSPPSLFLSSLISSHRVHKIGIRTCCHYIAHRNEKIVFRIVYTMAKFLFTFILLLLQGGVFSSRTCPPEGFDALGDEFSFESFISARWYSIKQKEVSYQPASQFYCVYAEYRLINNLCLFCLGRPRINVFNRALRGSVDGEENSINLRAILPYPNRHPARAFVAFRFFPFGLIPFTNYWVVAAGKYADVIAGNSTASTDDNYEWAIITTGKPNREGQDGKCFSRGGMWIFARDPVPPSEAIDAIEAKATEMGLDVTQLLPVEQATCDYSEE